MEEVIRGLKNSNSSGLNNISTSIVKKMGLELLPAITHIVNLSIMTNKFPTMWKRAKFVLLLKSGDRLDPKNYRPVAILPVLSKILERIIFNQMLSYMSENKLLHPNHHAYRPGHSTTTALLQMHDTWL